MDSANGNYALLAYAGENISLEFLIEDPTRCYRGCI